MGQRRSRASSRHVEQPSSPGASSGASQINAGDDRADVIGVGNCWEMNMY